MVGRIKIDPTNKIFKVSRAGFDVATAPVAEIAFDGYSGDPYAGVYLSGETNVQDGTWNTFTINSSVFGAVAYNRLYRVISLGKTFTAPPQVIWNLMPIGTTSPAIPKYAFVNLSSNYGNYGVQGVSVWASCSTTDLTLRVDYPPSYAGAINWKIAYMVFQT